MKNFFKVFIVPFLGLLLFAVPANMVSWELFAAFVALVTGAFALSVLFPVKNRGGYAAGVVTQYGLQENFDNAKAELRLAGLTDAEIKNAVLSMSYLRLEQQLVINQSLFTFPVLVNAAGAAAIRPTEVRLDQQDAFFCNNISVYIFTNAGSNIVPKTYPNAITFPTGAAQLYSFYNGFLKITINKSVIVPSYPMLNFLQIPQTQLTGATNTPADQFDPAQVALWQPTINFIGTKSSTVQIQLPAAMTAIDANTYCAIELQGVLAQNVTVMS